MTTPPKKQPSNKGWGLALLAFIGLVDASYLAFAHYAGLTIPCGASAGCDIVTTSQYAFFWGLPLGLWGVFYYGILLVLALWYWDRQKIAPVRFFAGISGLGVIASTYFVYLQLFVIGAVCFYCLGSAIVTTVAFLLAIWLLVKKKI